MTFEFDACPGCVNALDALIAAARVFGEVPSSVLADLCPACAESALNALT